MVNRFKGMAWRIAQIGADSADDPQTRLSKYVLMVGFSSAIVVCLFFVGPLYLLFGEPLAAANYIGYSLITLIVMSWFARHHDHDRFGKVMGVLTLLSNLITVLALGNFINSGGAVLWGVAFPLVGTIIFYGVRRIIIWIPFVLLNMSIAILGQPFLRQEINVPPYIITTILLVNLCLIFGITVSALAYFVEQRNLAFALLQGEQQKAENLLLNILPPEIAHVLKNDQATIAKNFEGASIMFADIVNFTPLSASMSAIELVELLNEIFSYFDGLVEHYELEKIKTIGDCYMVAAGGPRERDDHAMILTRMALEVQRYIASRTFKGQSISFRIGINSGAIVAGVIGRKKFIYDLWGDAVNTASRMESHGAMGTVQVTRSTYDLIKASFDCEAKGEIYIKGKGQMEVWHVTGEKANYETS
jgi:adenylate cyclase